MAPLSQLIQTLCDANIDFVVVGGFAAILHGSGLMTRDLDVCAVQSDQNVEKLRAALRDFHPTHRLTPQRLSFLENPDPLSREKDLANIKLLKALREKQGKP